MIFAIGAIMRFATNVHSSSFNIQTIGVILMIVGAVGFVVSLFFWGSWGGFNGGGGYRRRAVYRNYPDDRYGPNAGGGRIIEEEQRRGY